MSTHDEIKRILDEAGIILHFIEDRINKKKPSPDDDYKKLNYAYYKICIEYYKSFIIMTCERQHFSSMVVLRALLELYTKSFYLEFIEKEKETDIKDIISEKKDFPKFVKMAMELDNYKSVNNHDMGGMFKQFTKKHLASYEKFSYFSHGKGPFLQALLEENNVRLDETDVHDILLTAKGIFETLSLLYFKVQKQDSDGMALLDNMTRISPYQYNVNKIPANKI